MSARKPAPATKQDLRSLEGRMTKHFDAKIRGAIRESEKRMTATLDRKLTEALSTSEASILHHFDLTVETIRHDLAGANADEIESIRDDITLIKRHV